MTRGAALLVPLILAVSFAAGCDATGYEDCKKPEKEGTGEERCVPSTFPQEDKLAREALGFVNIGTERVPNALVSVDGKVTATDDGGLYRFRDTPFRYDLSALIGEDVLAYRGVALRFLDLVSEREAPIKAFIAKVALSVPGAPRSGNQLAFFVSGENVAGISGTLSEGLTIASRTFSNDKVKVHVVEYPEAVGLAGIVAKGSVDVRVTADDTTTASVALEPAGETKTTMFETTQSPPPGFAVDEVELLLDFGTRLSQVVVRKLPLGTKIGLPVLKDANWSARSRSTRADGAVITNGIRPFAPGDTVGLTLFAPPEAVRSDRDVLVAASAQGTGVFEHVLVPLGSGGGGKTVHLFSASAEAKVPDLQVLGLPPARGEYRWTVRVFPDFTFVESMSGIDNRLFRASSTSSPRTIVLP